MDISFVTTAKTDKEAKSLLNEMGLPFKKNTTFMSDLRWIDATLYVAKHAPIGKPLPKPFARVTISGVTSQLSWAKKCPDLPIPD